MINLPVAPKIIETRKNQAIFELQGLYPGYGVTIGNALRRVLLSSLEGVAVTEVKIKGASHEFSTIPGVLEDVIMILLNVKNLRFTIFEGQTQKVSLSVKGEREVTGADFDLSPQVKLANPELHIATLTDKKTEFEMELTLQKGIGYEPKEYRKIAKPEIGAMILDAIYTPIKNVNFNVENMRVGDRTDFDKLALEIETDGTITPEEAFYQATEILIKHFEIILANKAEAKTFQEETEEKPAKEKKVAKKQLKKLKSKIIH